MFGFIGSNLNGQGGFQLADIICDNMVLQQESNVPLWGKAASGQEIIISAGWLKTKKSVIADKEGKWKIFLKTPAAGGPYRIRFRDIEGLDIIIRNVKIGEVWLCSGQSNMEMPLRGWMENNQPVLYSEEAISEADYPDIRLFTVERNYSDVPLEDCEGRWEKCSPEVAKEFSAVGYFFGLSLYKKLNVPIGLIHSSWGGTPAEAWTNKKGLETIEKFKNSSGEFNSREYLEKLNTEHAEKMVEWEQSEKNKKRRRKSSPEPFCVNCANYQLPAVLFNAMINPIVPYEIKGAIWYQGESNRNDPYTYRDLFPAMIKSWRKSWKQDDFPFYFVQIAPYTYGAGENSALVRESQLMSLAVPNTGMVVTMDVGDLKYIHPPDKKTVGERLALWALSKDYGFKNIVYSGPLYKNKKVEGKNIRLFFDYSDNGLLKKGKKLTHFYIAGKNKKFFEAKAIIEGNTILVYCNKVKSPVAVRYAWSDTAEPNLFNKAGLPASSFRTDDWEDIK